MPTRQGSTNHDAQTHQLVGEMMFRANVTLVLAQLNRHHDLLSDTSQFIRTFDYSAGIQYLQAIVDPSFYNQQREPQIAVFQLLGYAYRSLPHPQAHALMYSLLHSSHIKRHLEARGDTLATFNTEYPQLRSRSSNPSAEANPWFDLQDGVDLPKYTSALFERGQEEGEVLQRTSSTLTLDPPRFKVTIQFGVWNGSGTGRNKKTAGHLAAKDLCDQLGITV